MELRHLKYFIAVAECGSVSAAANQLYIAQPALSSNIKSLEEELGTKLFIREWRGVRPSEDGERFLERALAILKQVEQLKADFRGTETDPQGSVSVVMPASVAYAITTSLVRLVKERYPRIHLNIDEGLTGNMVSAFESRQVDLLIDFDTKDSNAYKIEPLIKEELFFVGKNLEGISERTIEFNQLKDYQLIVPKSQHAMHQTISSFASKFGADLNLHPVSTPMHPMLRMVCEGQGYSLLPWPVIESYVERKELSFRQITNPTPTRTANLVYPSTHLDNLATTAVAHCIRDAVTNKHNQGKWAGILLVKPEERID